MIMCLFSTQLLCPSTNEKCFMYFILLYVLDSFPGASDIKASAYNAGNQGSIPQSRRSPGEGNGTPLQYSCLENPMDGGSW